MAIFSLFCLATLFAVPKVEAVVGTVITASTVTVLKFIGGGVGLAGSKAVGTKIVESFSKNGCWPIGIDDHPTVSKLFLIRINIAFMY